MCSDRDGTIDIVVLTCVSIDTRTGVGNECHIDITYNQQRPLCSKEGSTPFSGGGDGPGKGAKCRDVDDLCTADPDFKFEFDGTNPEVRSLVFDSWHTDSLFIPGPSTYPGVVPFPHL